MAKIDIEVKIPGNAKTYEFRLDDTMTIGQAKKQMMNQITEMEGYNFFPSMNDMVFCSVDLEGILQDGETFRSLGLKNASRVVLV